MKILIVDDNSDDRRILRYVLQTHGHDVMEAVNGRAGLQAAAAHKPDLIISDVLMPVMDGFQFLRNLRESDPVPFIFYSAVYDGSEDMRLATSLRANGYIIKPKEPVELLKEIERIAGEEPAEKFALIEGDAQYLKRYSRVVVSKLEEKVLELEEALAERKKTEELLLKREQEFRSLAESLPDNIVRYDLYGRTLYVNPRLEKTLGMPAENIIGRSPMELHPDGRFADYIAMLNNVIDTGIEDEMEMLLPDGSGGLLYHQIIFVPERDYKGTIVGILAIGRDITKLKRGEQALLDKQQRLSDMALELSIAGDRERRRIATNLHDTIGQDLALTRIKLGMLAKASLTDKEAAILGNARDIVNNAIKNVRHLTHLVSPPILESAGLEVALKWLGIQMETDYGLQVLFEDDLSEKAVSREVCTELYFTTRELLINIAKHAETVTACVKIRRNDNCIVITVEDNGAGFNPDCIEADHFKEGSGFGLFNIRRRLIHLGGTFELKSSPRNGTMVTIGMPLNESQAEG